MNTKLVILLVLVFSAFLAGCTSSPSGGYASYNQPQGQGQPQGGQYVGGGCGVAPNADYAEPVEAQVPAAL